MPVKTAYAPGEPVWNDLGTPDLDGSRAFYGGLFGWTAAPGDEDLGGYTTFTKDGRAVAGLMPVMSPEQPTTWTCYVCTDDLDKTADRVADGGGTTLAPPMDVTDLGRMAVFADPTGAVFGAWQPRRHTGAELVEEDGAFGWIELGTRDQATALAFYERVFGWTARPSDGYTELQLAGRSVAGCMDVPPGVPDEVPAYWLPYVTVTDVGAAAERATELGGTVVAPVMAYPGGEFAVVQDPQGAVVGLVSSSGAE